MSVSISKYLIKITGLCFYCIVLSIMAYAYFSYNVNLVKINKYSCVGINCFYYASYTNNGFYNFGTLSMIQQFIIKIIREKSTLNIVYFMYPLNVTICQVMITIY